MEEAKSKRKLKIVVSVVLQDAGEATRSLEIMKGVRDRTPDNTDLDVIFLSHGSKFEQRVIDNGFQIHSVSPKLDGSGPHSALKMGKTNLVGDPELAVELLKGEISALKDLSPDLVLYGFWPFASIARRMQQETIPGICFLPIPMEKNMYTSFLMKDVPDVMVPLTYLPLPIRKFIMRSIPQQAKLAAPIMRQYNILSAAKACGWNGQPLQTLFDMLKSDLTIVNDLPGFYKNAPIPENYKITGPLFAPADVNQSIDPEILRVFDKNNGNKKIFCTLGSSGTKDLLLEAIKAIQMGKGKWNTVILAPSAVCPLDEARRAAGENPNIYVTDQFVPAPKINSMADIVVSHGGQGTVQTAIASGTPIVGFAMQPEQQINLDNVALQKAAIRIPVNRWKANSIHFAIEKIVSSTEYKTNMASIRKELVNSDGKMESAKAIWDFIDTHLVS